MELLAIWLPKVASCLIILIGLFGFFKPKAMLDSMQFEMGSKLAISEARGVFGGLNIGTGTAALYLNDPTLYAAMGFALFFLGEYANMILMCSMVNIFFLGDWLPIIDIAPFNWIPGVIWFGLKTTFLLFVFVWVRAAFPRYRYDQLMRLGWKVFLPFSLGWVIFISGIFVGLDWLV